MSELSSPQASSLMRSFESALEKLKLELQNNLGQVDLLDRRKIEQLLELFNQRFVIAQHEFLDYISRTIGEPTNRIAGFELRSIGSDAIPELAMAAIAGGGAAILLNVVTFSAAHWIFWTTTTTAAATVGTILGVSAGIATAGIGFLVALGAGYGASRMLKGSRRDRVRSGILKQFDSEAAPKLRAWARERIADAAGDQP
ncbi:MAG: hypothetical protein WCJ35_15235 [Planctomycetota bacterium]